jgi:hypothetical protein
MKSQERLILLGDKLIFMIKLDLTEGEVPPHPSLPLRGGREGWGGTIRFLYYATLGYIEGKIEGRFFLTLDPEVTLTQ